MKKEFLDRYDAQEVLRENRLTAEQIAEDVAKMLWSAKTKDFIGRLCAERSGRVCLFACAVEKCCFRQDSRYIYEK